MKFHQNKQTNITTHYLHYACACLSMSPHFLSSSQRTTTVLFSPPPHTLTRISHMSLSPLFFFCSLCRLHPTTHELSVFPCSLPASSSCSTHAAHISTKLFSIRYVIVWCSLSSMISVIFSAFVFYPLFVLSLALPFAFAFLPRVEGVGWTERSCSLSLFFSYVLSHRVSLNWCTVYTQ